MTRFISYFFFCSVVGEDMIEQGRRAGARMRAWSNMHLEIAGVCSPFSSFEREEPDSHDWGMYSTV